MLTAVQIRPPLDAPVGRHFVTEHPDIAGVWVVARVPPPQLPTLHGVIFWGADGYEQDVDVAKQFATVEVAASFARLMNS